MAENNLFPQVTKSLIEKAVSLRKNKIEKLKKQIASLDKKKDVDVLDKRELQDLTFDIFSFMRNVTSDKKCPEEVRRYFDKINDGFNELVRIYHTLGIRCFGVRYHKYTDKNSVKFSGEIKSVMHYIAKEKPAGVDDFIARSLLKIFAVNFKANKFYAEATKHLKEE